MLPMAWLKHLADLFRQLILHNWLKVLSPGYVSESLRNPGWLGFRIHEITFVASSKLIGQGLLLWGLHDQFWWGPLCIAKNMVSCKCMQLFLTKSAQWSTQNKVEQFTSTRFI
jgi:hypothetical protein